MRETPELILIREVLEGMVTPSVAAAVLFTALEIRGDEPSNRQQWLEFVGGPLRDALNARTGRDVAAGAVGRIAAILGGLGLAGSAAPAKQRNSQYPTGRFPTAEGPTRVVVIASSAVLARRLKSALGSLVVPMVLDKPRRLTRFIDDFDPHLVIVDLTDPASGLDAMPSASRALDDDVLVLVWDEGSAIGKGLAESIHNEGRRTVLVDRREGVDPIIDIVRASQS